MKRLIWLMLSLNVNGVFADVNDMVSKQISGQIARSTSNVISQNINANQMNRAHTVQRFSAPNSANHYQPDGNFSDSNETFPPSYFPTDFSPDTSGFNR